MITIILLTTSVLLDKLLLQWIPFFFFLNFSLCQQLSEVMWEYVFLNQMYAYIKSS